MMKPVKGVKKSVASHRGTCRRGRAPAPTPKKPVKNHPPPPKKLPETKRPNRPKVSWPVAPDGFIPNSVLRSMAPFPPRSGAKTRPRKTADTVQEQKPDFMTESVKYVDGLIKKYGKISEEKATKTPSSSFTANNRRKRWP